MFISREMLFHVWSTFSSYYYIKANLPPTWLQLGSNLAPTCIRAAGAGCWLPVPKFFDSKNSLWLSVPLATPCKSARKMPQKAWARSKDPVRPPFRDFPVPQERFKRLSRDYSWRQRPPRNAS